MHSRRVTLLLPRLSALYLPLFLALILLIAPGVQAQVPQEMPSQGYLFTDKGTLFNRPLDFSFALYDAAGGGAPLWQEEQPAVSVADGIFSVRLGTQATFNGLPFDSPLWLGVQVNGGPELTPRVALSTMNGPRVIGGRSGTEGGGSAIRSTDPPLTVNGIIESTQGGFQFPDGTIQTTAASGGAAWQLGGNAGTTAGTDFIGTTDGQPLEVHVNAARVMRYEPETATEGPNVVGGWSGNSMAAGVVGATIAGGGDPDNAGAPRPNQVTADYGTVSGGANNTAGNIATVGGGENNTAEGSYATVSGGLHNTASGNSSSIAGGVDNTTTNASLSTISGGRLNIAGGFASTIGGGYGNAALSQGATVGGGTGNTATGLEATVPGGSGNQARGDFSFAAGRQARAAHDGAFVWSDASTDSLVSTADNQFLIRASGGVGIGTNSPTSPLTVDGIIESTQGGFQFPDGTIQTTAGSGGGAAWQLGGNAGTTAGTDFIGTTDGQPLEVHVNAARVMRYEPETATEGPNVIGGWSGNSVAAGIVGATIAGGGDPDVSGTANPNAVNAEYGTIGGGQGNFVDGIASTVSGGTSNTADGERAAVGGGFQNRAIGVRATVSGGSNNTASGDRAAVGGGAGNTANGNYATVGGGTSNRVDADRATVGGGSFNKATSNFATVGGGSQNIASNSSATVGGGSSNTASAFGATVGGGQNNKASGSVATVPGGAENQARGDFSFAAGYYARAAHDGAFVWSDNSLPAADSLISTAQDQFLIRAGGGIGVGTNAPLAQLHLFFDSSSRPHLLLEEDNATDYTRLRMKNTSSAEFWDIAAGTTNTDRLNFYASNGRGNVMSLRATGDPLIMHNGAKLTEGGTWTNASSRYLKTDFEPVDGEDVLARLAELPVETWRYKAEADARRMGPTAEDFYQAFGLGDTDKAIATVDADGVALAAIQALYRLAQDQQDEIATLKADMAKLRALVQPSAPSTQR